ncbi:MAG TPA: ANTAR domain-containing protein [Mycobacteriales bacterium]|nr:ANTAR domain-containing protein [Mycobacteriales bacterium]
MAEIQRLQQELATAQAKIVNLNIALQTSREIGAAIGVLMATRRISADRAFDLLREHSQRTHRKVRDIAADVVFTGSLDT